MAALQVRDWTVPDEHDVVPGHALQADPWNADGSYARLGSRRAVAWLPGQHLRKGDDGDRRVAQSVPILPADRLARPAAPEADGKLKYVVISLIRAGSIVEELTIPRDRWGSMIAEHSLCFDAVDGTPLD